jgi:hypothetical protein
MKAPSQSPSHLHTVRLPANRAFLAVYRPSGDPTTHWHCREGKEVHDAIPRTWCSLYGGAAARCVLSHFVDVWWQFGQPCCMEKQR